jgi:hypothetical protein
MTKGISNNDEMIRQFAKACAYIADVLPRTELTLILYPTERIKEAVAHLYTKILGFVVHAVKWYRQGKLAHAWAAFAKPWSVTFKDHVEDIGDQAKRVNELSSTAAKAELRDAHLEIMETRKELQITQKQIQALSDFIKHEFSQLVQLSMNTQTIQQRIQVDITSSSDGINQIKLNQILDLSFMVRLPSSNESLNYCQTMQQRRRGRTKMLLPDTTQMQKWSSRPNSHFLITETTSKQASKDFVIDILGVIRGHGIPVLWALRFPNYWELQVTFTDILRVLVRQALQMNPDATTKEPNPLTAVHLREAESEEDWLRILNRALYGVPQVFVVLDADLLNHVMAHDRYSTTKLLEQVAQSVKSVLKIVISSSTVDVGYAARNWDPENWSKLRIEVPEPKHLMRARRRRRARDAERRMSGIKTPTNKL